MKIAFLTTEFVTEKRFDGGLANYLHRVTQAERQRGNHVEVFTQSDHDEEITNEGVLVHRVGSRLPRTLRQLTLGRFRESLSALAVSLALRRRFLVRHRSVMFDAVQASQYRACGLLLSIHSPVPVITRLSSFEPFIREANAKAMTWDQRVIERLELAAIRSSNGVYSPSHSLAMRIKERAAVEVSLIRPPFFLESTNWDVSLYCQLLKNKRYLVFVGQLSRLKGVHVLDKALAKVLPNCPDMHFVFVGRIKGNYFPKVMKTFPSRVHYLGVLQHSKLYPIVANSQGMVVPSLVDNLPNVCLEAMALARPVIGTRHTGLEELIEDRVTGLLTDPGDVDSLAHAMMEFWGLPNEKKMEMGHIGSVRLERFDSDRACQELEDYIVSRQELKRRK